MGWTPEPNLQAPTPHPVSNSLILNISCPVHNYLNCSSSVLYASCPSCCSIPNHITKMSIKLEQSFAYLLLTFRDWWVSWVSEPDLQEPTFPPGPPFTHNTYIFFRLHTKYPDSKSLFISLSATCISFLHISPNYPQPPSLGNLGDSCPSLPGLLWWSPPSFAGCRSPPV